MGAAESKRDCSWDNMKECVSRKRPPTVDPNGDLITPRRGHLGRSVEEEEEEPGSGKRPAVREPTEPKIYSRRSRKSISNTGTYIPYTWKELEALGNPSKWTEETKMAVAKGMFTRYDADRSNYIDLAELTAMIVEMDEQYGNPISTKQRKELYVDLFASYQFEKYDLDGDEQLTMDEFILFFVDSVIDDGLLVCGRVGKMLEGGDGKPFWEDMGIRGTPDTWSEAQAQKVAMKLFDMYDIDESGEIDKEEFIFMITEMDRYLKVFGSPLRVFSFADKVMKEMDHDQSGSLARHEFVPLFVEKVIRQGFEKLKDAVFLADDKAANNAKKNCRRWRTNMMRKGTGTQQEKLGLNLEMPEPGGPPYVVVKAVDPDGIVAKFNAACPSHAIAPGDRIVKVGGKSGTAEQTLAQRLLATENEVVLDLEREGGGSATPVKPPAGNQVNAGDWNFKVEEASPDSPYVSAR
jgi:Ca2+-binding EF-hand superfamily protein